MAVPMVRPFAIMRVIDRYNYVISQSSTSKPVVVHREKPKLYYSNNAQPAGSGSRSNDVTTTVQPHVVDENVGNSQHIAPYDTSDYDIV
jgi:hypothetical protein